MSNLPTIIQKFHLKVVLISIGIVWLSIATNYISLDKKEEKFLQHHWWARTLVVFLVAFAALDLSQYNKGEALFISAIITGGYYLLAEL